MGVLKNHVWRLLNWPNRISILRLVLVIPFTVLISNQQQWFWARWAALGIFGFMAISDFLDGWLARKYNLRTRLGAILDPLADKVLIICSVILLSLPDFAVPGEKLPTWIVAAVIGKDVWVVLGFFVVYMVTNRFFIKPTIAGKSSTFCQLVMVLAVLAAPDINRICPGLGSTIARILGYAVMALCAWAMFSYARLGIMFVHKRQKPLDEIHE